VDAAPRIDWKRAGLAAHAAELAYRDGNALAAGARRLGLDVLQVLADAGSGANACLLRGDGLAVLAVRGTERDYRDILTDLDFRKQRLARAGQHLSGAEGRVHSGFLRQAAAVVNGKMGAGVRGLLDGGTPVIACGHSLGGAVALLAAIFVGIEEAYTYGAPRVGDRAFARCGRVNLVEHNRFVRAADIVPHLPLLGLGFRHNAPALYFDGGGRFKGRASLWRQWAALAWRALTGPWMRGPIVGLPIPAAPFTDHRVAGYPAAVDREAFMQGVIV